MRVQAHHRAPSRKTPPRGHGLARWLTGMRLLGRETGLWTFSFSRQVELGFYGSTSFLRTFWQSAIANLGVKPAHCRVCCFGRKIAPLPIQRSAKARFHRGKPGGGNAEVRSKALFFFTIVADTDDAARFADNTADFDKSLTCLFADPGGRT